MITTASRRGALARYRPTLVPPPVTHVVQDTFTRLNNASTLGTAESGQTWVPAAGTWGVTGQKAYAVTPADGQRAVLDVGLVDQHVLSTVTVVTGAQLIARSDSTAGTCYVFGGTPTNSILAKIVNGTFTTLQSGLPGLATGDTIQLDIVGSTITCRKNGTSVYSRTDTAITTGTYAGIRQAGGGANRWDDFFVD